MCSPIRWLPGEIIGRGIEDGIAINEAITGDRRRL